MNATTLKSFTQPHSFNELAMSYLASHAASLSESQFHRRLDHLGAYLLDFFGSCALTDISPAKLQKFAYHLEAQGLKSKDIEACMVSFRVCVKHAVQKHWDINLALLKPGQLDDGFVPEPAQMSKQEYTCLYQDLLQDLTTDMFH